jgi:Cys-tRNA(Pro)/Cys-tRNA(Cys) deacylase
MAGCSAHQTVAVSAPTPAVATLVAAGISHVLHEFDHTRGVTGFGDEAVDSLGLDPSRVFKTLVVTADDAPGGRLFVGVLPISGRLDPKAMGAAVGCKRVHLADVADAERSSGYVVGAISPIGQRRPLRTVVDPSAFDEPTMFVSGGRRGLELELAPAALVAITDATVAVIAQAGRA